MNNKVNVNKCETVENHCGEEVFKLNALETLFSKVLGSFFGESTFYEDRSVGSDFENTVKLLSEVPDKDIEYILKLAVIGRRYGMISYPLALLTACFNDKRFKGNVFCDENGKGKIRKYSKDIVLRGKDITDVLAMQLVMYGREKIPMQLRRELKNRLESFNEYKISKALGKGKLVSMSDAVKMLHPNPNRSKVSAKFFKDVIEDRVKFGAGVKQIQNELSRSPKDSSDNLDGIIESIETSSLLALLKNLSSMSRRGVFNDLKVAEKVALRFKNKEEVLRSKILPFRFYSAYMCLRDDTYRDGVDVVYEAVEEALENSIENLEDIEGHNAILVDVSGSMTYPVSEYSKVTAKDIALLLGAICYKKGNSDLYVFGNRCSKVTASRKSSLMDIVNLAKSFNVGGASYLKEALQHINKVSNGYDNLIILSDSDCYSPVYYGRPFSFSMGADSYADSLLNKGFFKRIYLNNLLGNDFSAVNVNNYRKNLIVGFSEKIVTTINMYEELGSGNKDIRVIIDSLYNS